MASEVYTTQYQSRVLDVTEKDEQWCDMSAHHHRLCFAWHVAFWDVGAHAGLAWQAVGRAGCRKGALHQPRLVPFLVRSGFPFLLHYSMSFN